MIKLTQDYFEKLLQESRQECLKIATPACRDAVCKILLEHAKARDDRVAAEKKKKKLEKEKASKDDIKAVKPEIEDANHRQKDCVTKLFPYLEEIDLGAEAEGLHVHLMKCSILTQQGPKEMEKFCNKHGSRYAEELLQNNDLMKDMLINGGAKDGKFLEAYKLFDELMELLMQEKEEDSECYRRLALGSALELAVPIGIFGHKKGGDTVDPRKRFLHYVKAHKKGELDPSFPYFTPFEYRFVVNSDSMDEELQWGRDHLLRYRPDMVAPKHGGFRYCKEVKTDVGYRKPDWGEGQKTYKKLLSNGGKCGPRAWHGRFLCKAFGVPTWGVRQPGHAAVARWTPNKGWLTVLGGGLHISWWEGRDAEEFVDEAHARLFQRDEETWFRKVTLLECMSKAHGESPIGRDPRLDGDKAFWNAFVLAQRRCWSEQATDFTRIPKDKEGEESCRINQYLARKDKSQSDKEVKMENGRVIIPACSFTKQVKLASQKSFEGGGQLHFEKKTPGLARYEMPSSLPKKQYELRLKICTVHEAHNEDKLHITVNDKDVYEVPSRYTAGEWMLTSPVKIEVGGGDVLEIARRDSGSKLWGLTFREFSLTEI